MGKEPRWFKIHRGILKPRLRNKKAKKKRGCWEAVPFKKPAME